MDATPRQVELFDRLTTDREFPAGTDIDELQRQFAKLDSRSASAWIDKAMKLPKLATDGDTREIVPPSF